MAEGTSRPGVRMAPVRNLVLGIGLTLVTCALGWFVLDDSGGGGMQPLQGAAEGFSTPETPRNKPPVELEAGAITGRSSAILPDPASLEVRVVNPEGGPLDKAQIGLRLGLDLLEARGSRHTFDGLPAGHFVLTVQEEGFPTWEQALELRAGERTREVIQLRVDIKLSGLVVDRFGAPRTGMQLWFLRPGQRHPMDSEASRELISAITDRNGQVQVTLPEAGEWRLSTGRIGQIGFTEGPRSFQHGGPDHFELVVGGMTRLEVQVQFSEGPEPLTAIVMARREDLQRARSEEKPETDPVRQKRLEAALAREALQGAPPTRDSSRQAPAPVVSDWVNRKSRRIGGDGKTAFTDLPPGEEFRLAIVRQGERYESSSGLYLRPDQLAVAKARVPAPSTATAEVVMPLPLTWQSRPLTPDERPAGISWSIR